MLNESKQTVTGRSNSQTEHVVYNLNRNLWVIRALATEKLQIRHLQKTDHVDVRTPFQLVYLSNKYEAYSMNIYISATVELTSNNSTLTLQK